MDQIIRIGMDTSKHIFQLHGVNAAEVPILRKKLRRKEMVAFFEKLGKRCGVGTLRFALGSKLHSSFPSDDGIAAGVPLAEQGLW